MRKVFFLLVLVLLSSLAVNAQDMLKLDRQQAGRMARLAFKCIHTEYANNLSHSMQSDKDVGTPSQLHPVFYGCYDWHSSVHGHWLLVKLLKEFPDLPARDSIISAINLSLTPANIAAEVAYLKAKDRISYERPYGWSWLLKLSIELSSWDNPLGEKWFGILKPLAQQVVANYKTYLPGLYYPLRRGVHANTAFGISFALDYARAMADKEFEKLLLERSRFYYLKDKNIPAAWEPEGDDFFSPALIEADLMRRVLTKVEFEKWFKDFLPVLPPSLQHPAVVANRADPTGVHLDGLNLSRAWCMFEVAKALPAGYAMAKVLKKTGDEHARDALPHVISENYLGTHWLATFAIYMYFAR
ncbi:MAG: DUF2891 domain-containing protein [Prolixibacteraceae bacterium]